MTPKEFKSTAPSLARKDRKARGHGSLRFSKDLSKAYVDVKLENVDPDQVVMFHIHCGKPDMLGPIIVDFGIQGSFKQNFKKGLFPCRFKMKISPKQPTVGTVLSVPLPQDAQWYRTNPFLARSKR
jgi:hypothetical protein